MNKQINFEEIKKELKKVSCVLKTIVMDEDKITYNFIFQGAIGNFRVRSDDSEGYRNFFYFNFQKKAYDVLKGAGYIE